MQMIVRSDLGVLQTHLSRIYTRLNGDLSPVMSAIGGLLENSTRKRFETKTDPDGARWAALKPTTLAAKANKSGKARGGILIDQGDLLSSITHRAESDRVLIGSGRAYAAYHQTGAKHMPARPIFGISTQDRADIEETLTDWIEGAFE